MYTYLFVDYPDIDYTGQLFWNKMLSYSVTYQFVIFLTRKQQVKYVEVSHGYGNSRELWVMTKNKLNTAVLYCYLSCLLTLDLKF